MDIARPELKQRKRRRHYLIAAAVGVLVVCAVAGIAALGPAIPSVDRSGVLLGIVKHGNLQREVRGPGMLVPRRIRWITAETPARVDRILIKPGASVTPDTIIMQLSNPEVDDRLLAAKAAVTAAQADLASRRIDLQSRLLDEQSALAQATSDAQIAEVQVEAEKPVAAKGVIPMVQYKRSLIVWQQARRRVDIEKQRVAEFRRDISAQLAAQQARLDQLASTRDLRQRQADALRVRAGISGVLQQVPVEEGQQVAAGANLARVAQPNDLMAELNIAEVQAKDVAIGQRVKVDTRNGIVDGQVTRIDPGVRDGSVRVDVELSGKLPAGARPDLSVDGNIEIENLVDVLYVGRPAFGQPESDVRMFRVDPTTHVATRVAVRFGKASVNLIQIRNGLKAGDRVVLSDTTALDRYDRIRLE